MSAGGDVFEVTLWQKTGERSAMGSGAPRVFGSWREAAKFARKWMKKGPAFFVSVGHFEAPFSERRAAYAPDWDWFCATSGGVEFRGEHLDAPKYISAGSMWSCDLRVFSRHLTRGGAQ